MRLLANDLTNQMYENAKNEIQKVHEIEESFVPATVWQYLNVKCRQPETEVM